MSEKQFSDRVRQLRNLVVMAFADGSLGEREVDYVAQRCHELELGEADLTNAIRFGLGDDAALELPSDPAHCEELLVDLIKVMAADGVLDENEKRLFALAAAKMNVSAERLNELLDRTLKSLD
ncbi:TerB family tellurite resistance protein [Stieleria sp. JC731]|uniref:TerB family tellurite resistance protein n=1 Tax=Pirellulaceae TaxID=2691357 RepID=UPI001E2C949D|nr:TerB family tellurite resistance protein [Stieleria sp. JC731]MCC9601754.1 TerB family tellurite resistance protein [Stieleria sp. JC731]